MNQPASTVPLAVIDIDGVLADARHRLHLITGTPTHADWLRFFASAVEDPLLSDGAALAHKLAVDHRLVYLTARPEIIRPVTLTWLEQHKLPPGELRMKRSDDHRPARLMKLDTVRRLNSNGRVALVVDDDPRVVELLTNHGYSARLATWCPWSPLLDSL